MTLTVKLDTVRLTAVVYEGNNPLQIDRQPTIFIIAMSPDCKHLSGVESQLVRKSS